MRTNRTLPPAILLGMDCVTALQAARILHAYGVPVVGLARRPESPYCASRALQGLRAIEAAGDALSAALNDLAREIEGPALLLPCTDDLVGWLSEHRQGVPDNFRYALPDHATLTRLTDKTESARAAADAGLHVPRTHVLRDPADAETVAAGLRFPCVVKPAVRTPLWLETMQQKVFLVPAAAALHEVARAWLPRPIPLVVQEWIEGDDSDMRSVYAYFGRDGAPLAALVARKIRQWPIRTGVGSLAAIADEPELLWEALQFLQSAGFRGLGSVQFKRGRGDGRPYFVEVNAGRPALNLPLAEAGGLPMFWTMYCDLMGRPLPEPREVSRPDAKWICWKTDLASAWTYWRLGELRIVDWWRSLRGPRRSAVFSWSDPAPFVLDVLRKTSSRRPRGRGTRRRPPL